MRQLGLVLNMVLMAAAPAVADTIRQVNAEGKVIVVQRDAIVVKEDSSSIVYKHFELKDRRVVKVRLEKGSLPYVVERGNAAERQRIVESWKLFGFKATVTDRSGKAVQVFDVFLDFYPPGGRGSLLESVPPRTNLPVLLDKGGGDEISFSEINRVEFHGDRLKLIGRNGQTQEGRFVMPTDRPAEARFLGITDHYDPALENVFDFSLPLAEVKEIQFEE